MKRILLPAIVFTLGLLASCQSSTPSMPASPLANEPSALPEFGTLLVETAQGNWLLVGDAAPRPLAEGEAFTFSPDGCWLLYKVIDLAEPRQECWLARVDGSHSIKLFPDRPRGCTALHWAADSTGLAFTTRSDIKAIPSGGLWWVSVPDGTVTALAQSTSLINRNTHGGSPSFSPDGQWIVTSNSWTGYTKGSVSLVRTDGNKKRQVFYGHLHVSVMGWSEDSSGLWVHTGSTVNNENYSKLWWVRTTGGKTLITRLNNNEENGIAFQPRTKRLAIGSDTSNSWFWGVYLLDKKGNHEKLVPGSEGMTPFTFLDLNDGSPWSPDGRWLFVRPAATRYPYLVDAKQLTEPYPLDVGRIHGWLDDVSYLASVTKYGNTELYRCKPPKTCQPLGKIKGKIDQVSYTPHTCSP